MFSGVCFWLGKMVQGKRGCSRKALSFFFLLLVFSMEELMAYWVYYYHEPLGRGVSLCWSRQGMMWARRGDKTRGMAKPTCGLESH